MNDAVVHMRQMELEQEVLHLAKMEVRDFRDEELAHNNALASANAQHRLDLKAAHESKMLQNDESSREEDRNDGLEPLRVYLAADWETQDTFQSRTNVTNDGLNAHGNQIYAENQILDAEKQTVWLSLEQEERDEWWFHENSIAVEEQNPHETISKEYHHEQMDQHDMYLSDLTQRNADLAATVPGLTADRDAQEDAKIDNEIAKKDMELQAVLDEMHVVGLQKSKAALEKLIMQYQRANTDLTTYNTELSEDILALTSERDALRISYEEMTNQRNEYQIKGDYYEDLYHTLDTAFSKTTRTIAIQDNGMNAQLAVCETRNTALTTEKASLVSTNQNLRDTCY